MIVEKLPDDSIVLIHDGKLLARFGDSAMALQHMGTLWSERDAFDRESHENADQCVQYRAIIERLTAERDALAECIRESRALLAAGHADVAFKRLSGKETH